MVRQSLDWLPKPAEMEKNEKLNNFGSLIPSTNNFCITAGLSIGIAVGVSPSIVPDIPHHLLLRANFSGKLKCGLKRKKRKKCVNILKLPKIPTFRARTPTSAGMNGIQAIQSQHSSRGVNGWSILKEFGLNKTVMEEINAYFINQTNIVHIATDNLR